MSRPNLSYLKNLILAIVAIPAGVLTGVTGLSCVPVLQPTLRWLIGLNGSTLNGVLLVMISFMAWSGLLSFSQSADVLWANGFVLTIGTFVGAAGAGKLIPKFPIFFAKARPVWTFLPLACALLMIAEATGMVRRPPIGIGLLPASGWLLPVVWSSVIGIGIGFIGFVGDLGSMLVVPSLMFLLGSSILQSEGTALYILVLASLPTALIHALRRTLNVNAALALSIGGLLGALFGTHLAVKELAETTLVFLSGATLALFSLISLFRKPITEAPLDTNAG